MTSPAGILRACAVGLLLAVAGLGVFLLPRDLWEHWAGWIGRHALNTAAFLSSSYQRTPAVVIGLAAAVVLPILAIAAAFWRHARKKAQIRAAMRDQPRTVRTMPAELQIQPAWLVIDSAERQAVPIERELFSIGREQDNDVRIADPTIHRYHALVQRTAEAGYVITDVSGPSGNGIRVNGARIRQARLASGDRIDIGRVRMTFARQARPVAVSGA
jgi:hypothetical protein